MREVAKLILTVLALAQGAVMLAVELNRTHATNPDWPGHARFHLVWQNLNTALMSVFVTGLLWWPTAFEAYRFFLATMLASIPLLGFIAAHWTRPLYGGSMSDPNGVPPLRFSTANRAWELDGNTLAVALGLLALGSAILIFLLA